MEQSTHTNSSHQAHRGVRDWWPGGLSWWNLSGITEFLACFMLSSNGLSIVKLRMPHKKAVISRYNEWRIWRHHIR